MATKKRRRRAHGSLADLRRGLWSVFLYNLNLVEDGDHPHELRLKASNGAVQSALAWMKATEQENLAQRIEALEEAMTHEHHTTPHRNGTRPYL